MSDNQDQLTAQLSAIQEQLNQLTNPYRSSSSTGGKKLRKLNHSQQSNRREEASSY